MTLTKETNERRHRCKSVTAEIHLSRQGHGYVLGGPYTPDKDREGEIPSLQ